MHLSQSAPGSEGLSRAQFVQWSSIVLVNLTSVDDLFRNLGTDASTGIMHNFNDFLFESKNILSRHTVHPRGEPAQRLPQSKMWTGTCLELSSPASYRLDAITEDHHSCAHRSISFQTYCHRVCQHCTRVLVYEKHFHIPGKAVNGPTFILMVPSACLPSILLLFLLSVRSYLGHALLPTPDTLRSRTKIVTARRRSK